MNQGLNQFQDERRIKIVFLGDKSVGKTSIIKRFIRNQFQQHVNSTIGIDYMFKKIKYKNKSYKLELWDTAGQEKYRSLVSNYLKDADCAIFVYDINNMQSYRNLKSWVKTFKQTVEKQQAISLLVANKIDCRVQQCTTLIQNQSQLKNYQKMQVSAKEGINIYELFDQIMVKLQQFNILSKSTLPPHSIKTLKNIQINKKICCLL